MNTPYGRHRPPSPDFIEAWRTYQAANARAAEQYEALPTANRRWLMTHPCQRCAGQTYDPERMCRACRGVERWSA